MAPMREARGSKRRGRDRRHPVGRRWLLAVAARPRAPRLRGVGAYRFDWARATSPGSAADPVTEPGRGATAGRARRCPAWAHAARRSRRPAARPAASHPAAVAAAVAPDLRRPRPRPARRRRSVTSLTPRLGDLDVRRRPLPPRLDHQAAHRRRRAGDARPRHTLHHPRRARRRPREVVLVGGGDPLPGQQAAHRAEAATTYPRRADVVDPRPRGRGRRCGGRGRACGCATTTASSPARPTTRPGAPTTSPTTSSARSPRCGSTRVAPDRLRPLRRPVAGRRRAFAAALRAAGRAGGRRPAAGSSHRPGRSRAGQRRERAAGRDRRARPRRQRQRGRRGARPTTSGSPTSGTGSFDGGAAGVARDPQRARRRRHRRRGVRRPRALAPQPALHRHPARRCSSVAAGPDRPELRTRAHRAAGRRLHRVAGLPLRRGPAPSRSGRCAPRPAPSPASRARRDGDRPRRRRRWRSCSPPTRSGDADKLDAQDAARPPRRAPSRPAAASTGRPARVAP